jgi:hypothetical protein
MDEEFDTPALRVLRHIARKGPINMREFAFASGSSPKRAKFLREKLTAEGYLVSGVPVRRVSTDMGIDLTPTGRRLAEMSLAQEEFTDRVQRRHAGASDSRG